MPHIASPAIIPARLLTLLVNHVERAYLVMWRDSNNVISDIHSYAQHRITQRVHLAWMYVCPDAQNL